MGDQKQPEPTEVKKPELHSSELDQTSTAKNEKPEPPHMEINQENGKTEVQGQQGDKAFHVQTQDNGSVQMEGHMNVREMQLDSQRSLDLANETLRKDHVEIGSDSAAGMTIKQGSMAAHTNFPLSINPQTGALTVTTPAGQKTVTVLPDQAVQNLIRHNVIDRVQSGSGSSSGALNLTLFDNKPAFEVQGVEDKKFLGLIPVAIDKTSFVSAESGQVLKTEQSFLSAILSAFSF